MNEPRSVPIHQSLQRNEMVMGAEREPIMCTSLFCGILIVSSLAYGNFVICIITIFLYVLSVYLLRKMAKADPIMTKVWQKRICYQEYYPARTSVWTNRPIVK